MSSSDEETLVLLRDLFTSLGGPGWHQTAGWLSDQVPFCEWYGLRCDRNNERITGIFLSRNNLSGFIPSSLGNLTLLVTIDMENNEILGEIPQSIGHLSKLEELYLGGNALSGPLPSSMGSLVSMTTLYLSDNLLSGDIPVSLATLCSRFSTTCLLTNNPNLCGDHSRVLTYTCSRCENCAPQGQCHNGYSPAEYLCSDCPPNFFDGGGNVCSSCTAASSPSSTTFVLSFFGAVVILISLYWLLVRHLKVIRPPPPFSLGLKSQVRLKQFGSLLQMLPLLAVVSDTPLWFKRLAGVFGRIALPLAINTQCVIGVQHLWDWQKGCISFIFIYSVVIVMVYAKRLLAPLGVRRSDAFYAKLQTLAGFVVTQSLIVILRVSFDADQILSNLLTTKLNDRGSGHFWETFFLGSFPAFMSLLVAIAVALFTHALVEEAGSHYRLERARAEVGVRRGGRAAAVGGGGLEEAEGREATPSGLEEAAEGTSIEQQLDANLPFWASFCLPYTPSCAEHESNVVIRKVLSFFMPGLVKMALCFLSIMDFLTKSRDSPLRGMRPFPPINYTLVSRVESYSCATIFVAIQIFYLRHLLKRP